MWIMVAVVALVVAPLVIAAELSADAHGAWSTGEFGWQTADPIAKAATGDFHSIKDPSIVFHGGKWHLFCTVRGTQRSHAVVYMSFEDFAQAASAPQQVLPCHAGYFCAPQVFYFAPQKRWYLLCQASDASWDPKYRPAFATSEDIADPAAWSPLKPLGVAKPAASKAWLDFWIICDESNAHLFYTSLDGKMWHSQTVIGRFPDGWSEPKVALEGDIFEASHTYRLRGMNQYVTIVEAQNGAGWRYYKAYLADRLAGPWRPLADTREKSFASMRNVTQSARHWTDVISHVEILRSGYDEKMEIDPDNLRVIFQGVTDAERSGKNYGQIPWKLGLLRLRDDAVK